MNVSSCVNPPLGSVKVTLADLKVFRFHIEITHRVDEFTFQTKVFYPGVDLLQLGDLKPIYAHIAVAETFKYCSLFPSTIDFRLISPYISSATLTFFMHVFQRAYSQCKYENQVATYQPTFLYEKLSEIVPFSIPSQKTLFVGNGGGKDSFLAMKLLEKSAYPYSTYQWTRTEYGKSQYQNDLCSKLLTEVHPQSVHKVSVFDDFTESPFISQYFPHLKGAFTLGIPECIFEALPVMVANHYTSLCFANEKSSDTGNIFWEGEEVNHQWVKTLEAELCFQEYIQHFLVTNFRFFSLIKPIYDYRIFQLISHYPTFIKNSHSCNIDKPWCKKCPKCAYVWLGYLAHFEKSLVDSIFGTNPFDDEDLIIHYKHMTGIEGHRSFECIGNIEECQLFMKKCIDKGLQGKMLTLFKQQIGKKDWAALEEKYNQVHREHNIPSPLFQEIKRFL